MPGLLTYRTLASASSGNRATGGHAVFWPKPGKKLEENLPPPHTQTKAALVLPLQVPPSFLPSQTQVKQTSKLKNGMDSFTHIMQARMHGDVFNAERRSHLSSGSEHEPSSVCLADMVHDFIEDEPSLLCNCGRVRCSCEVGNANSADVLSCSLDKSKPSRGGDLLEILKGFTSGVSAMENALLTNVIQAMASVKERGIEFCNEGIECISGCFKRAIMKHLRAAGYNAAICKSRWDHAVGFAGGHYEYMDVIEICNSASQRLVIDIQFRAQFEIARPTDQYSALLQEVPAIFVGKSDRLLQILNVMSDAVKISLKKNGMHLPPWRKPEYIKAKWFSPYRRTTNIKGQHIKNCDNIISQDFRWGPKLSTALELQYEKGGARQAVQELIADDLGKHAICPLKTSEGEELQGVPESDNSRCDGDELIIMLADWQPPRVNGRGSSKPGKIAGLASALLEAGLTTLANEHNVMNYENNFALPAKRAVTAA
ncbi:hypothetical protein O6H91_22G063400 [Diphasiastrum complanatum]|uniref:Uncharacterized protein n=1 Tax=Diphasiastrum complanatum TaxID=34168 RepID=A0ACC2AG87_DIPCM|nr:hypothetical protein O6H91_Y236100 [Diphasiastrum complanatum]KAJ7516570.1 hypothetical protein O6H91_22G063400 [Diphasiastrum complanatum]